jgi:hypothetical protein
MVVVSTFLEDNEHMMSHEQDKQIQVDDFIVILDNDNARVFIQFVADMPKNRKPEALVIERPYTNMFIEDDRGIIIKFTKTLNMAEFFTLTFMEEAILAVMSSEELAIKECFSVPIRSKLNILQD